MSETVAITQGQSNGSFQGPFITTVGLGRRLLTVRATLNQPRD